MRGYDKRQVDQYMTRVDADEADGFARFIDVTKHTEAVLAAHRLFGFNVELDQPHGEVALQIARHAADGAGLAVEVEHGHVAFG